MFQLQMVHLRDPSWCCRSTSFFRGGDAFLIALALVVLTFGRQACIPGANERLRREGILGDELGKCCKYCQWERLRWNL